MSFALSQIPGYAEALQASREGEFSTREDAWWNLTFDICGIRLRTMTVRDYEVLLRQRNPLLLRQMPSPEEMLFFFWLLSPENDHGNEHQGWLSEWRRNRARSRHQRRASRALDLDSLTTLAAKHDLESPDKPFVVPEDSAYAKAFAVCIKYIDRMFFDRPAGIKSNGIASGMSYLTDWFCNLQREFHLPTDEIERMALPELFARLKEIQAHHNPQLPDFNRRADDLNRQVMEALRGGMTESELLDGKLKFRLN